FKTDILTEQTPHYGDLDGPYAMHYAGIERTGRSMVHYLANPPQRFASALAKVLDDRAPFVRRTVGLDARMLLFISRILPSRLLHHVIRLQMNLPRHGAIQRRLPVGSPRVFVDTPSQERERRG